VAVETTVTRANFTGTGASATYAPGFYVNSSDQVKVYVNNVLKTIGDDYTVNNVGVSTGCTVVANFPLESAVYIERQTPITQLVDTQNNETILEDVLDAEFDKLTMIAQELNGKADRAILLPKGENGYILPSPAVRASKAVGFDALGGVSLLALAGSYIADVALLLFSQSVAGAVVRTLKSRLSDTMHLTDFGATTAASDNSAAITAALTWLFGGDCRRLIIPHGDYACTNSILVQTAIATRHSVIEGSGARIRFPASGTVGMTIEVLAGGTIRGLTIRDLEFQGGRDQLTIKAATLATTFVYALKIDGVKHYSFLGNGLTLSGNVLEYELCNFDCSSLTLSVFNAITGAVTVGTDPSLLVVSASAANTITVGDTVGGIPGARIVSQLSGTPGGVGNYRIDRTLAADVAAQAMITCPVGYGIHILNGPSTGVSSSVLVKGGSTRGGVHGLCHEGPANEINIEDGTYLQAGREGVISTGSQGSVFKKLHVENNWVSAGSVAAGRAGLRVDGVATLIGIRGECNGVTGFQKYVVQCTPTAGGITIIGGQKALGLGASGKFGRYSKPASGELILIGAAPNDYDVISGAIAVTSVGNVVSPVQQGYVENFIAYAAAVTPDLSLGAGVRVGALTGNITINNPTNRFLTPAGTSYMTELVITLQQDATGGRTVTWGSDFATGMPAIDATASKYSIWTFRWINGKWRQVAFAATA